MKANDIKKILLIGAKGGLAQITIELLTKKFPKARIIGIDSRPLGVSHFDNVSLHSFKYTRSNFEKIFRENKFDLVMHLGRLSHAQMVPTYSISQRLDLNLVGTNRILKLCLKTNVKKLIIMSTYHVYGAYGDNPTFIDEEFPLRASIKHPELRDVVEMDQISTNWMWKNQDQIQTIVLRPCSVVGPRINNAMTMYLKSDYAPLPMDYNPMFQCIHEYDMARTLVESVEKVPIGIFNIAPNGVISLRSAKELVSTPTAPVPLFLIEPLLKTIAKNIWDLPYYLIDYLKYSCILDNSAIKFYLGDSFFKHESREALEFLKLD